MGRLRQVVGVIPKAHRVRSPGSSRRPARMMAAVNDHQLSAGGRGLGTSPAANCPTSRTTPTTRKLALARRSAGIRRLLETQI